ncbi:glycosyltransferase [Patescibacteria group bacterium]|nr:glycosyltransferase [Patescibacteria group bacterium]
MICYSNYQIVIVNNRSEEKETKEYFKEISKERNIRVIDFDKPFHFSKLYNWAVKQIDGEYMLMLNNDIKVLSDGWLESMLEWCQLPEVGSVGAKLYYPNGKIQHAGVIVGAGGAAAHSHRLMDGSDFGYEGALVNIRNYLAVTGACLFFSTPVFSFKNDLNRLYLVKYLHIALFLKELNSSNSLRKFLFSSSNLLKSSPREYSLSACWVSILSIFVMFSARSLFAFSVISV